MTEPEGAEPEEKPDPGAPLEAAIVQTREVVKWLIASFAAVGVALAAGSQLSDLGSVEGWRLAAGFGAALLSVGGIALAIFFAVKVMTPRVISLRGLVRNESKSPVGEAIAEDKNMLRNYGTSIKEFEQIRTAALKVEDQAWDEIEKNGPTKARNAKYEKVKNDRERIDQVMTWLFSFGRYKETERAFRNALRAMFLGAALAAVGIAGFAWAAHPKDEQEGEAEPVVAKSPAKVIVDLNPDGTKALRDDLGPKCKPGLVRAIAIAGNPDALDVVTVPTKKCELTRFTLTDETGTYETREPPPTRVVPPPPVGVATAP